jgi:hypothetical protein
MIKDKKVILLGVAGFMIHVYMAEQNTYSDEHTARETCP